MEKKEFAKQPKTIDEQLNILKKRGMTFNNESKARFLLSNINYYRLSGYWFENYTNWETKNFKKETSFEMVFNLYKFDKDFRKIISGELEKIEISIRTHIAYVMSLNHNSNWYEQDELFDDTEFHKDFIEQSTADFKKSKELFIKEFKKKYTNARPPSWIIIEIISFGTISKVYQHLNSNDKQKIAKNYGVSRQVLVSWLRSLTHIRNLCAHHSRLWNRKISNSPIIPRKNKTKWVASKQAKEQTSYLIVVVIAYMLKIINPNTCFKSKLLDLLNKYPEVGISKMGFPEKWYEDDFWNVMN